MPRPPQSPAEFLLARVFGTLADGPTPPAEADTAQRARVRRERVRRMLIRGLYAGSAR